MHPKPTPPTRNPIEDSQKVLKYYNDVKQIVKQIQDGYKSEYKSKYVDWTKPIEQLIKEMKLVPDVPAGLPSETRAWDSTDSTNAKRRKSNLKQKRLAKSPIKLKELAYIKAKSIYQLVNQIPAAGRTTADLSQ